MKNGTQAQKVICHFLRRGEDDVLNGEIRMTDRGEMILSVTGGSFPYLIVGKPRKHSFEGSNTAPGGSNVCAKWVELDAIYVGTWVEEGDKYLFSFEVVTLPPRSKEAFQ
jgi:hypothetical protein